MSGPVLVIELAEPVPPVFIQRLRELFVRSSSHFGEKRVGEYGLSIHAESLGIAETGGIDGRRPVMVSLMGPGIGDENIFEAEHADEVDRKPLIGFTPTHAVDVIAFCNRPVDHVVTALLTAAVMDVIGGVANAELREDQVPIVTDLPGVIATVTDPWPAACRLPPAACRLRFSGIPQSVGSAARLPAPEVVADQLVFRLCVLILVAVSRWL